MLNNTILEEVSRFAAAEIRPHAGCYEKQGGIPRDLIARMAARGYLGAAIPDTYGGLGLDPVSYGLFTETIGMASDAVRSLLTVHTSLVSESILRCGSKMQKEQLLPLLVKGELLAAFALTEPETGTDAKSLRTSYTACGADHFIIDGTKKWITMGAIANLLLVIAGNGTAHTAFLVETDSPGITVTPMRNTMAGGATHLAEIVFQNVRVPRKNILGLEGNGFVYVANTALDFARYSVAWGATGVAAEALNNMVAYSRQRKQFGQSISAFQLVRGMIADSVTKLRATRALCLEAGRLRTEKHKDAVMETIIAKYQASKAATFISTHALQVHGANGFSDQYPAERLFREARVFEIIEGTSQVLQEVIAGYAIHQ